MSDPPHHVVKSIKGGNPQNLIPKIVKERIRDSRFWKEKCFALTPQGIVEIGVELKYIAGVIAANNAPSPFVCLLLKMLQINVDDDIVQEMIDAEDFKYIRLLGCVYHRLVADGLDVYEKLEPILMDYRRVKFRDRNGRDSFTHVDEIIESLLFENEVIGISLPALPKRIVYERMDKLKPYVSQVANLEAKRGKGETEEEKK